MILSYHYHYHLFIPRIISYHSIMSYPFYTRWFYHILFHNNHNHVIKPSYHYIIISLSYHIVLSYHFIISNLISYNIISYHIRFILYRCFFSNLSHRFFFFQISQQLRSWAPLKGRPVPAPLQGVKVVRRCTRNRSSNFWEVNGLLLDIDICMYTSIYIYMCIYIYIYRCIWIG